jgi:hypothetical protein
MAEVDLADDALANVTDQAGLYVDHAPARLPGTSTYWLDPFAGQDCSLMLHHPDGLGLVPRAKERVAAPAYEHDNPTAEVSAGSVAFADAPLFNMPETDWTAEHARRRPSKSLIVGVECGLQLARPSGRRTTAGSTSAAIRVHMSPPAARSR